MDDQTGVDRRSKFTARSIWPVVVRARCEKLRAIAPFPFVPRERDRNPNAAPMLRFITMAKDLNIVARRRLMQSIRKADTRPEMTVRRIVFRLGYRYRLHDKRLPGTPDLVFAGRRQVVFVHGCWWHRHSCRLGTKEPKSNTEYWVPKLARNVARDAAQLLALQEMGWEVLVIWECETSNEAAVAGRLAAFLGATRAPTRTPIG
jgi:DNA mismatch endonuclease (patch repair protein)